MAKWKSVHYCRRSRCRPLSCIAATTRECRSSRAVGWPRGFPAPALSRSKAGITSCWRASRLWHAFSTSYDHFSPPILNTKGTGYGGSVRRPICATGFPLMSVLGQAKCTMSAIWVAIGGKRTSHTIRGRSYCAKNPNATTSATMLAKISSAGRDFRVIGLVEWRAAD
jgi:hypothetical protein